MPAIDSSSTHRKPTTARPTNARRAGGLVSSLLAHALLFALFLWAGFHATQVLDQPVDKTPIDVVYLQATGPAGGGGGGAQPAAPATPEIPHPRPPDPVPVVEPATLTEPPPPTLDVPMMTSMSNVLRANGNSGVNLAAYGGGKPGGSGPGNGNGLGPGDGGNTGGGPRRPGNGCAPPTTIREVRPSYTGEGMKAKIQGDVTMEAVVRKDGTVGDVRVIGSLDRTFGLDDAAVKAARAWVFRPATCQGAAVDMVVTITLEFRLH